MKRNTLIISLIMNAIIMLSAWLSVYTESEAARSMFMVLAWFQIVLTLFVLITFPQMVAAAADRIEKVGSYWSITPLQSAMIDIFQFACAAYLGWHVTAGMLLLSMIVEQALREKIADEIETRAKNKAARSPAYE